MVELRLEAAAQERGHDDQRSETRGHRTTGLLPLLHVCLLLGPHECIVDFWNE